MSVLLKRNTAGGLFALLGSMLLHALSGVVVVGLSTAFGNIGQVTFRALAALGLTVIASSLIGYKYRFSDLKKYNSQWLLIDFFCRPICNICFVYAVLSIGPTAALFYLFASKVVFGGLIKVWQQGILSLHRTDHLSYLMVIIGLFVFTYPPQIAGIGIIFAITSGIVEATKSEAMGRLSVSSNDRPMIALCEFATLAMITATMVLITNQSFVIAEVTNMVWFVLGLSATIAVGSLYLELAGFTHFDPDLGNVVLATEMGFASLINFLILGTAMTSNQIAGATLLTLSLCTVTLASYMRNRAPS